MSRNKWWGLTVICFGTMMSFLNVTLTVSDLGPIQQGLHASSAELVWIASVYSMAVASLVLTAGTLGDMFGRRAIFALGTAFLGAGSLASALADSPGLVIAGQALAGVGGAMVIPNALAAVSHAFPDPRERSGAVAIWATVSGAGLAIGPVAAGGLLKAFSWHSVFLVNVALAVVVLALTFRLVAESRHPNRRLDPLGLVLGVIAIGVLNYAVIEGGNDGFGSHRIVIAFGITAVALIAFVAAELRNPAPMLHLKLFGSRTFASANVAAFLVQYAFVGIAIAQVLWFEQVRGASILSVGLRLLPLMAVYVLTSTPAGRLAQRAGFKVTITAGLVLVAGSTLLMTQQTLTGSNLTTAVLLGVLGVGCGLALPSTIAAAVISVPHSESGMASASVNTFRQLGSALGASITGTIITSGIAHRLPAQLTAHGIPAAAQSAVARAIAAGQSVSSAPAALRPGIHAAAGNAFADSLHVAVASVGIGAVVMAVLAAVFLANRPTPVVLHPRTTAEEPAKVVA